MDQLKLIDDTIEFNKKMRNRLTDVIEKRRINKFIAETLKKRAEIVKKIKTEKYVLKRRLLAERKIKGDNRMFNKSSKFYLRNLLKNLSKTDIVEMGFKSKKALRGSVKVNSEIYQLLDKISGDKVEFHVFFKYRVSENEFDWSTNIIIPLKFKDNLDFIFSLAKSIFTRDQSKAVIIQYKIREKLSSFRRRNAGSVNHI